MREIILSRFALDSWLKKKGKRGKIAFEMKSTAFIGAFARSDIFGTQFGGLAFLLNSLRRIRDASTPRASLYEGAISFVVELQPAGSARFKSAFPFLFLSRRIKWRRGEMLGRGVRWARIIISSLLRYLRLSHLACLSREFNVLRRLGKIEEPFERGDHRCRINDRHFAISRSRARARNDCANSVC